MTRCALFLLCYLWMTPSPRAVAAVIDVSLPSAVTMIVISSDPDPDLPWTYGTLVNVDVQPGDTLRLPAGDYSHILFWELASTADAPITITNHGGVVACTNTHTWSALTVYSGRHVRLTGTGTAGIPYGFLADTERGGAHSVQILGESSHIEIDHVEVSGAGFAGFNVKNEISASGKWNRGTMEMVDIHLHHNYVHDTSGEGFYIGHTFSNGKDVDGDGDLEYPHVLRDLVVEHNRVERTGAEGIQVGSTIDGMVVAFNEVIDPGVDPFANYQDNGIQIGMSKGLVLGNRVLRARSNGLIILGPGHNQIVGNLIIEPGANGMFVDDRFATAESIATGGLAEGPGFTICNNTIIHPGQDLDAATHNRSGIRLYGADLPANQALNNVVVGGSGANYDVSLLNKSVPIDERGTSWSADGSELGFRSDGSWAPDHGSPLIDSGVPVSAVGGPWADLLGHARPDDSIDRGAFEFLARTISIRSSGILWSADGLTPADGVFRGMPRDVDGVFHAVPLASQ